MIKAGITGVGEQATARTRIQAIVGEGKDDQSKKWTSGENLRRKDVS
jgi:hypothetical protein